MSEEKVEFPLKPWQKALINSFLVAGITSLSTASSMLATGDIWNGSPHLVHSIMLSSFLAGALTMFVQVQSLFQKDLSDDGASSFTPLMLIGGK